MLYQIRILLTCCLCLGLLRFGKAQELAQASSVTEMQPTAQIDLADWKLTLPIDAAGAKQGKPMEVMPDLLVAGFQNEYFYRTEKGAIGFWCPVDGSTTKGTSYARCELREMINPQDDAVNWSLEGAHLLRASCRITQLPAQGKLVIGQIHGYSGTARPLVKLQYNKDRIEALVKISPKSGKDQKLEFAKLPVDTNIRYEIKLAGGMLSITVNDAIQTVNVLENDPSWASETFYFKAGAYPQSKADSSQDGARIEFSELDIMHAP